MKSKFLLIITVVFLLFIPKVDFSQPIDLGASANFVIYTTGGAVHDNASAHSHLTGDVGYYTSGDFLGFGNVNGVMRPGVDAQTTACELALLSAIAQINGTSNDYFPGLLLGNGVVYPPGVYSIPGNATMTLDMILDAQNVPSSEFIIKINGTFSAGAAAKVKLINGAQACKVFWLIEGQVDIATNTTMRGTIIANNSSINMATGDSLEGRLLSTTGAITIDGITAYTPQGCGSPVLTGPNFPNLGSIACYSIYSSNGALTNTIGTTFAIGDVGNNGIGTISGWEPAAVTGTLHLIQDPSTIQAEIDLSNLYNDLNAMVPDIELLYPAQFGNNLVLTPHIYEMNSAATFTDSLTLDAQGNADGVFVIKITGGSPALSTSTYSKVKLINGAQAKNVFWLVNGAVNINNYSDFNGNIVVPNGAINLLNTGVVVNGRALTMVGAITTAGLNITMPPGCLGCVTTFTNNPQTICDGDSYVFSGNTYTVAGDYNDTLISFLGCDSIIVTQLTVNPTYEFVDNEEICDGEMFLWRGNNYSTTDTFYDSLLTINNCDSVYVLNLTVNQGYLINNPQEICDGDSYSINSHVYTLTGNYSDTLVTINGCDSIIITQLTVNPVFTTNNPQAICDGDSYTINGNTYTIAGTYYDTLSTVNGCDSVIITVITIESEPVIITQPINQTICEGDSVSFTVVATGANLTYQWRKGLIPLVNGGNISGADSSTLTINPATISDIATNYNVVINGGCVGTDTSSTDLTSAYDFGILAGTAITSTGFSEIHDMNVGLSPGVHSSITGFPPAIVVNGDIYASDDIVPPGVAAMLIQAKQDLTDAYLYAEGATAPAPATVAGDQGGATLTPGIYKSTSTLLIQSGDLTLDAQGDINAKWIFQIASDLTTIGGAGGNVILIGGAQANNITWQVGSSATIGNYTSFSGNILALTSITMNTGSSIDGRLLAINGAVVLSGTNIINGPSDSVVTFVSQSISINVSLMVNPLPDINSATTGNVCSGIAQNYIITSTVVGTTYNWSRAAVINISNTSISNQTSNPITEILYNISTAPVNVIYLMTPSANGCIGDIFNYTVTVYPVYTTINPQTICDGGSYTINGNTYTIAGNYNDTLISINGCDSIVITQLAVFSDFITNNPQTICDGDSYIFNGNTYTLAGNYNDTLVSVNGCDSIIVTQLTVIPSYSINNPQTICDGGSYTINGNTYTIAGNYNDTMVSVFGCDSIIITQLTVTLVPVAIASSDSPVCAGNSINLTAQTVPGATYLWTNSNGYSSTDQNAIVLIATATDAGTYTLSVTVDACASVFAEITVIVSNCDTVDFFIPEGFSPNGDGINDLFVIRGIDNYPENTFLIYNRWGDKVFEASPYQNTWDGKSTEGLIIGGDELPISTYFYILDLGNGSDVYKGTIYLNK